MKSKIGIIIRREYLERVQKKSFIITTILMPVLIVALMIVPALIMAFQDVETKTVAVIDESGIIAPGLQGNEEIQFVNAFESRDSLLRSGRYFGVLTIDADILARPQSAVKLYTTEASSLAIESMISSRIQNVYESEKLKTYDIPDLDKIMADIDTKVAMQTYRTDRDEEESQSSGMSYAIGLTMEMILYMLMFIYGAMVMNSIIEEKNNRVLELVVSSVKPSQLMLGKIVGIGLVAVTQIMIWAILICVAAGMLLPAIIPADVMTEAQQITSGAIDVNNSAVDPDFAELAPAIVGLTNVGYILSLFGYLILFLVGGFMFYAAMFAAIGSAVDNVQDASQLQSIVSMPIIIGMVFSMTALNDPNGVIAMALSFIPFTAPMMMMIRIPFGIDAWQIWTSLIVLYASFFAMVWLAAKIYRVGIFMYGKKPTVKDLIKWARYK